MEEKEVRKTKETAVDDTLTEITGGSWVLRESKGRQAGITLRNADGSEGEWGNLWNSGDYYWNGKKLTNKEALAIAEYYDYYKRQPNSVREAVVFYNKNHNNDHCPL